MTTPDTRQRSARLPRSARRKQLLGAAREVFVAHGYHAAAMDEIAERAGVSKPVLYQHFPSKRELYLALVQQHSDELLEAIRAALASTTNNKQRVAATMAAYFSFIDSGSDGFRLVFESDLNNDPDVADLLSSVSEGCAEAIADVIRDDTGLPEAEAELLGFALAGMANIVARYWLRSGRKVPRPVADHLVGQLAWRGVRGFPKAEQRGEPASEQAESASPYGGQP
ncbi:MAG TPA: TetR/AcrR family transcriptional regulator [Kineosporiaceae bacterium]